jgi:hypothetical protein
MAPQVSVRDASGALVFYMKQKLFKLKEAVSVFADEGQTQLLYTMSADRVIDFSARYRFADAAGNPLGSVKRKGMRSMWRAHYDIFQGDEEVAGLTIQEESVAIRFADGCVNQIPIVGLFAGYFFNPAYLVSRADGTIVMRLQKMPAFFEGKFQVEKLIELSEIEEKRILLSLMMMLLLERTRG